MFKLIKMFESLYFILVSEGDLDQVVLLIRVRLGSVFRAKRTGLQYRNLAQSSPEISSPDLTSVSHLLLPQTSSFELPPKWCLEVTLECQRNQEVSHPETTEFRQKRI